MIVLKVLFAYLIYFVAVAVVFGIMLFVWIKFDDNEDEKRNRW
jgi:hypothetical protein